jgi:hypothetical protein
MASSHIISLREAGKRLARPSGRAISPQQVRTLARKYGFKLVPLSVEGDPRYRTGIDARTVAAIRRRRDGA